MNKEKSRPSGGTLEQQMELADFSYSISDCNTKPRRIASLLNKGRRYAVTAKDISAITGLNVRVIRQMIQDERLAGEPILATTKDGYFLPGCKAEIDEFIRSMRGRAAEVVRVADAVEAIRF